MHTDEKYMHYALELAAKARGKTSPNPMVGAVVINNGEIVGEGYHVKAGTPHAEVHALREAGARAKGATMYVTLEPCSHYGRTPPCADAIIAAGISKVVAAMEDPNPKVSGAGLAKLRNAGVNVQVGILKNEAEKLNEIFIHYITTGKPYVTLKTAATLDGKLATATGKSKWITGPQARTKVHALRSENDAVLTGIGTVLEDNPELTVRHIETEKQPLRVIMDSSLRIPSSAKILDASAQTLVFTSKEASQEKIEELRSRDIEVICVNLVNGLLDLDEILIKLGEKGITSIMVEAGPSLATSFLQQHKVNKWYHFIAPKLFGDGSFSFYSAPSIDLPDTAMSLSLEETKVYGEDLMLLLYPQRGER